MAVGGINSEPAIFNDVHVLDLASWAWKLVKMQQALPPPRFGHAACSDEEAAAAAGDGGSGGGGGGAAQKVYFFGGVNSQCDLSDLYAVEVMDLSAQMAMASLLQ